jgi:hypothetical protein
MIQADALDMISRGKPRADLTIMEVGTVSVALVEVIA